MVRKLAASGLAATCILLGGILFFSSEKARAD